MNRTQEDLTTMPEFDPGPYLRRLTRPLMKPGTRMRNRAILVDETGGEHSLVSGTDDRYFAHAVKVARELGLVAAAHVPEFAAHVHVKAAMWMRLHGQSDVKLVADTAPCGGPLGCDAALAGIGPIWARESSTLAASPSMAAYFRPGHDEDPLIVGDSRGIEALLDDLRNESFGNSVAALYLVDQPCNQLGLPDHELRVAVDAGTERASLRYMGGDGTWYSRGWASSYQEPCFYYMGTEAPFPPNSELSLDDAADSIAQFLGKQGRRPENIAWKPVDPW